MNSDELASLYDAHADALYGFLVSTSGSTTDASDLLQDVFVKIGRSLASVKSLENPRAYLLRTAYHAAIDATRRRQTRRRHESNADPHSIPSPTPLTSTHPPPTDATNSGLPGLTSPTTVDSPS